MAAGLRNEDLLSTYTLSLGELCTSGWQHRNPQEDIWRSTFFIPQENGHIHVYCVHIASIAKNETGLVIHSLKVSEKSNV